MSLVFSLELGGRFTVCNKPCDFFFLPLRGTKSHQILVIKDSFCCWVTTILIHKCNFSQSPILCLWEPPWFSIQNFEMLGFCLDLRNHHSFHSDYLTFRHYKVVTRDVIQTSEVGKLNYINRKLRNFWWILSKSILGPKNHCNIAVR